MKNPSIHRGTQHRRATAHRERHARRTVAAPPLAMAQTASRIPDLERVHDRGAAERGIILDASEYELEFSPDEYGQLRQQGELRQSSSNQIYYNPAIKYLLPKRADGTEFAVSSFTAARNDGFLTSGNTGNPSRPLVRRLDKSRLAPVRRGGPTAAPTRLHTTSEWRRAADHFRVPGLGAERVAEVLAHHTGNWRRCRSPAPRRRRTSRTGSLD